MNNKILYNTLLISGFCFIANANNIDVKKLGGFWNRIGSYINNYLSIGSFLGIILTVMIFVVYFICSKTIILNQLANKKGLPQKKDKDDEIVGRRGFRNTYNTYIPPIIEDVSLEKKNKNESITVRRLVREIVSGIGAKKVWIIIGDAGCGKSILADHLIVGYTSGLLNRLRNGLGLWERLRNQKERALEDRGVVYIQLAEIESDEELLNTILGFCKGNQKLLVLDSFDEYPGLNNVVNTDEGDDPVLQALKRIIILSLSEKISPRFSRIIINMRIGAIQNGFLSLYNLPSNIKGVKKSPPRILKIRRFNNRQALRLYRRIGGSASLYDEVRPGRYTNRMKAYLTKYSTSDHFSKEESIFQIPFLIRYADVWFDGMEDDQILCMDQYMAYDKLVDIWFEREFCLLGLDLEKAELKEIYKKYAEKYIFDIVDIMMNNWTNIRNSRPRITIDELKTIRVDSQLSAYYNSVQNIVIHNMLTKTSDKEYEFPHSSFMEYFISKRITSSEVMFDFAIRKAILSDPTKCDLPSYYVRELTKQHQEIIARINASINSYEYRNISYYSVESYKDLLALLKSDVVNLKKNSQITIPELLLYFPLIKNVTYNHFITLKVNDIYELIEKGTLNLPAQGLHSIEGIEVFGDFNCLDISGNSIKNIQPLLHNQIKRNLKFLYMHNGNEIEDLKAFKICLENLQLNTLKILVKTAKDLDCLVGLENIKTLLIDFEGNDELYILAYQKLKEGVNIGVTRILEESDVFLKKKQLKMTPLEIRIRIWESIYYLQENTSLTVKDSGAVGIELWSCLREFGKGKEALEIARKYFTMFPNNKKYMNIYAISCCEEGFFGRARNKEDRKELFYESARISKRLCDEYSEDSVYFKNYISTCSEFGILYEKDDCEEVEKWYLEAEMQGSSLCKKYPQNSGYVDSYLRTCCNLDVFYNRVNIEMRDNAENWFVRTEEKIRELHNINPENIIYGERYIQSCNLLGDFYTKNDIRDLYKAEVWHLEAETRCKELYKGNPENSSYAEKYVQSCQKLGDFYYKETDSNEKAEIWHLKAEKRGRAYSEKFSEVLDNDSLYLRAFTEMASFYICGKFKNLSEAENWYLNIENLNWKLFEKNPETNKFFIRYSMTWKKMNEFYKKYEAKLRDNSENWYSKVRKQLWELCEKYPDNKDCAGLYMVSCCNLGDFFMRGNAKERKQGIIIYIEAGKCGSEIREKYPEEHFGINDYIFVCTFLGKHFLDCANQKQAEFYLVAAEKASRDAAEMPFITITFDDSYADSTDQKAFHALDDFYKTSDPITRKQAESWYLESEGRENEFCIKNPNSTRYKYRHIITCCALGDYYKIANMQQIAKDWYLKAKEQCDELCEKSNKNIEFLNKYIEICKILNY